MRIRKRWPTTSTSTPDLPSNGLFHQHQFQQKPNNTVATTAARTGLHPNRFLAIWPQNLTHPIRFQKQNDGRDHQPLLKPHSNNDMDPSKNNQMPRNQVLQAEEEKESKHPEAKGIMDNTAVGNESPSQWVLKHCKLHLKWTTGDQCSKCKMMEKKEIAYNISAKTFVCGLQNRGHCSLIQAIEKIGPIRMV